MRRLPALALGGVLAVVATGCGASRVSQTALLSQSGGLIYAGPSVAASPTVFVAGDTSTETLPSGQYVTMTVKGPVLTNPVAGQKVQFANLLTETFTVTATTISQTPVTLARTDFGLRRFNVADALLNGPEQVVVRAGAPQTWHLALNQSPGQGYFTWRYRGVVVANWSYVAEND